MTEEPELATEMLRRETPQEKHAVVAGRRGASGAGASVIKPGGKISRKGALCTSASPTRGRCAERKTQEPFKDRDALRESVSRPRDDFTLERRPAVSLAVTSP